MEERYAVPVLAELYANDGRMKLSDLMHVVTSYTTLEKLIAKLVEAELVTLKRVTKPYKTNYAELTDLGWRVSKKLVAASRILNGEPEGDDEMDYGASPAQRSAVGDLRLFR